MLYPAAFIVFTIPTTIIVFIMGQSNLSLGERQLDLDRYAGIGRPIPHIPYMVTLAFLNLLGLSDCIIFLMTRRHLLTTPAQVTPLSSVSERPPRQPAVSLTA